jgi:pimeloyl-ACP methyl ester carboxylesterase
MSIALPSQVALERSSGLHRQLPSLGPPTASQSLHLEAARRLDVGPMPAVRSKKIRSRLGGLGDAATFRLMRWLFSAAHRRELEGADYHELEGGWLERSEAAEETGEDYFPVPSSPVVTWRQVGRLPDGGLVLDLEVPSEGYGGHRATARQMLARYPENRTAHARCYRHQGEGHPALIWLHGWSMGFHPVEAVVCRARRLYGMGLDVYLYVQPYHAQRRPAGIVFAGQVFPTAHLTRTNEGFLQAVWECRALMAWHRERGGAPLTGVAGLSLGGYLAAVLASVAPETSFAACLMPVADVPALIWSNGEGTAERRWAEEAGITFETFCRSMAVHAPLAHALAIPKERVLLVGAEGDRIIPPLHTEALWRHWGQPRLRHVPASHLVHFGRRAYLAELEGFLREVGAAKR